EEEHVTHYECLIPQNISLFEQLLWHEYTECYLYWSCYATETDAHVRSIWEENLAIEIAHLHKAADLLQKYENKNYEQVIPDGEFPPPLSLHENILYVRNVLETTIQNTTVGGQYVKTDELSPNADFIKYQDKLHAKVEAAPSHAVIDEHICRCGRDYRYETAPHPIPQLRDNTEDNTEIGRVKTAPGK
ncbi:MAG: hypothetical protein K2M48_06025, partial [Clostridiales bacterium]|nr:hypothetical protein [Clostridiales bacterium]